MLVDALRGHLAKDVQRAITKQDSSGDGAVDVVDGSARSAPAGGEAGGRGRSGSAASVASADAPPASPSGNGAAGPGIRGGGGAKRVVTNALKTRTDTLNACVAVLQSKQRYMALLVQRGLSDAVGVTHSLFRRVIAAQSANAYQQVEFDAEKHEQRFGGMFDSCAHIVAQLHSLAVYALPDAANRFPVERIFGCRLYATVISHFKHFKTTEEGALAMLADIGKIERRTKELRVKEVDDAFELLRTLVTLLQRPEESLVEAVHVGRLAVCDPALLAAYLLLRNDTERPMVQRAVNEVLARVHGDGGRAPAR